MEPTHALRTAAAPALTLFAAITCHSCSSAPTPARDGQPTHELSVQGDQVRLRVRELPVAEFVKVAQRVTQRRYTYDARQLAALPPISLVGEVRCARGEFDAFFATVLQTHGLATVEHTTAGGSVIEIRAL